MINLNTIGEIHVGQMRNTLQGSRRRDCDRLVFGMSSRYVYLVRTIQEVFTMTTRYKLTDEAKAFICKIAPTPERAQELIVKAESVFNCEQKDFSVNLYELKSKYGWNAAYCSFYLNRADCAELVDANDDWPLTDDEIQYENRLAYGANPKGSEMISLKEEIQKAKRVRALILKRLEGV